MVIYVNGKPDDCLETLEGWVWLFEEILSNAFKEFVLG